MPRHWYGVVDPMPMPSCFEAPQPTATASFIRRDAEESEPPLVIVFTVTADAVTVVDQVR